MTLGTGTRLGPVKTVRAMRGRPLSKCFLLRPVGATYVLLLLVAS